MQLHWTGAASGPNGTLVSIGRTDAKPTKREALDAILDALANCDYVDVCESRILLRCGTVDGVKLASYRGELALQLRASYPRAYAALVEGGEFAAMRADPQAAAIIAAA